MSLLLIGGIPATISVVGPTGPVGVTGLGVTGLGVAVQQPSPAPNPDPGPEFGGSSPIGLVVILILGIAVVFLIRSMNKHLRRVPKSFDSPTEPGPVGDDGGSASTS